jgi:hypothetical protein
MTAKRLREAERLVASAGLDLVSTDIAGSGHLKVRARNPRGQEETFVCAFSASDARGQMNFRSILRRFARGHSTKTQR